MISVHCGKRQVLVHAGAVLVRRLLHHSSVFRLHLLGPDLDRLGSGFTSKFAVTPIGSFSFRSSIPQGLASDDGSGHFAVFKHFEDVHVHPAGPAHLHFHLCVAYGRRNHSLGKNLKSGFNRTGNHIKETNRARLKITASAAS